MRPGPRDTKYRILIQGQELAEIQKLTGLMAEAFGLDRRIEAYQGTRPIGLYRWELDCLVDVLDVGLHEDARAGRHPGRIALAALRDRLHAVREEAYAELDRR